MEYTREAIEELITDKRITGNDIRVWLLLLDLAAAPVEIAEVMGVSSSNIAASCRKLHKLGWLELVFDRGNVKIYEAISKQHTGEVHTLKLVPEIYKGKNK